MSHSAHYLNCAGTVEIHGQEKKPAIQTDVEIAKILTLPDKDSKITMQKDTVAKMCDNMNEDMANFTREIETIIIIKNKRKS